MTHKHSSDPAAREARKLVWQSTACPDCNASAGERCTGTRGQLRWSSHKARHDLARGVKPELKIAEARAYQRGYAAGKRRVKDQVNDQRRYAKESAFWQRAMLAALPFVMTQSTWKIGGEPINTTDARVDFAGRIADQAVKIAKLKARL